MRSPRDDENLWAWAAGLIRDLMCKVGLHQWAYRKKPARPQLRACQNKHCYAPPQTNVAGAWTDSQSKVTRYKWLG